MHSTEEKDRILREAIMGACAMYVSREAGANSLITVTDAKVSDRGKRVDILISVYPPHKSDAALDFLLRRKSDMFEFIRDHVSLSRLPAIHLDIDRGEMNRLKVEEILKEEGREEN